VVDGLRQFDGSCDVCVFVPDLETRVLAHPDLVPFDPPKGPVGLLGLPTLWENYIKTVPRSAYEQSITKIRTRLSDVLIVSDPQFIQEILVEKAEAFGRDPTTRRSFAPVIGETSLFLAEGADWRWQRRAVAPIFRHETLLSFVPIFANMAQCQVERWCAAHLAVPIDAAAAMTRTTFEIIVEAMLGGSTSLDAERYSRALTDNFDTIPWHIIYVMFSIPEWMPYPRRRRVIFYIGISDRSSSPDGLFSPRSLICSICCSPHVTMSLGEA